MECNGHVLPFPGLVLSTCCNLFNLRWLTSIGHCYALKPLSITEFSLLSCPGSRGLTLFTLTYHPWIYFMSLYFMIVILICTRKPLLPVSKTQNGFYRLIRSLQVLRELLQMSPYPAHNSSGIGCHLRRCRMSHGEICSTSNRLDPNIPLTWAFLLMNRSLGNMVEKNLTIPKFHLCSLLSHIHSGRKVMRM